MTSSDFAQLTPAQKRQRWRELAWVFFRLGSTAFGGPAAHIALVNHEIVERRQWLTAAELLDLFSITQLLPGPNSTELVIHIGYARGGWPGLWIAGSCFILPAMTLVWILAALYSQYQDLPSLTGLLYGIKPVIMAIILQALWKLAGKAIASPLILVVALVALGGYLGGVSEIALLLALGLAVMVSRSGWGQGGKMSSLLPLLPVSGLWAQTPAPATLATGWTVFFYFLKVGSVLYGSGYVLLAFLQRELVTQHHWLTSQQLLDAIAVGQFTPGPVFTTATFVGYLLAGNSGAIAATVGIFLPAFCLVGLVHPWVSQLRRSSQLGHFLDGVNGASWGLMAGVTFTLGKTALIDYQSLLLLLVGGLILWRFKINSTWLVLAGGIIGLVSYNWPLP